MTQTTSSKLETAKQVASQTVVGMLRSRWRLPPEFEIPVVEKHFQSRGLYMEHDIKQAQLRSDGLQVSCIDPPALCRMADNLLLIVRHTENFGSFLLIKIWKDQG